MWYTETVLCCLFCSSSQTSYNPSYPLCSPCFFFFFQAEDGIRDGHVTGVQTCALPICRTQPRPSLPAPSPMVSGSGISPICPAHGNSRTVRSPAGGCHCPRGSVWIRWRRSEERRVGKEGSSPRWGSHDKKEMK